MRGADVSTGNKAPGEQVWQVGDKTQVLSIRHPGKAKLIGTSVAAQGGCFS